VVACAEPRPPEAPGVIERDSAGVRIVENPAASLGRELDVSPEPLLTVGVVEGAPEYQLFRVSAAARLSDGSIVVANGGSRDVRFYGPDGTHRATVGGPGQGPEEFRYPTAILVRPGDTVQVQDFMDRVTYAPDGTFLGRVTMDMGALQAAVGEGAFSENGLWLSDGSFFTPAYVRERRTGAPIAGAPFRPPILALRIPGDPSGADTLGRFGGILQQYVEVGGGPGAVRAMVPPFGASTLWAHGAPGGTMVIADSEEPQVLLFKGDGSRVVVRWPGAREPITPEEVEAWKETQRNSSWTRNQLPQLERGWAAMEIPAQKAAYGQPVAMGRDGSVWLPESPEFLVDPARFLVFTPEGLLRGRATLPGPFRVMDAGPDWVLGVWLDENEVEFLRLYRITE